MDINLIEHNMHMNEQNRDVLTLINPKLANRIRYCGTNVEQTAYGNNKILDCCNSKYCYVCSAKNRETDTKILAKTLELIMQNNYRVLSLTISPFNCYDEQEIKEIKSMLDKALKRFLGYSQIKKVLFGNIKKYEIAVNKYHQNHSFNLHLHVLLVVNSGYFNTKYYINGNTFKQLFDKALQRPYEYSMNLKIIDFSKLEKTASYFSKPFLFVNEELSKCNALQLAKCIYSATDKVKMFQVSKNLQGFKKQAKQELKMQREELNAESDSIHYVYDFSSSHYQRVEP